MSESYYRKTLTNGTNRWLDRAIYLQRGRRKEEKLSALDIGCGSGGDTSALVDAKYEVYALDPKRAAFKYLRKRFKESGRPLPKQIVSKIQNRGILKGRRFDLINASFSLPFIEPRIFNLTWRRILSLLRPGGLICVNLFGIRDSWAPTCPWITFLTRSEVRNLFKDLRVLSFKENEQEAKPALGPRKHWHTFVVIAQRRKK